MVKQNNRDAEVPRSLKEQERQPLDLKGQRRKAVIGTQQKPSAVDHPASPEALNKRVTGTNLCFVPLKSFYLRIPSTKPKLSQKARKPGLCCLFRSQTKDGKGQGKWTWKGKERVSSPGANHFYRRRCHSDISVLERNL